MVRSQVCQCRRHRRVHGVGSYCPGQGSRAATLQEVVGAIGDCAKLRKVKGCHKLSPQNLVAYYCMHKDKNHSYVGLSMYTSTSAATSYPYIPSLIESGSLPRIGGKNIRKYENIANI